MKDTDDMPRERTTSIKTRGSLRLTLGDLNELGSILCEGLPGDQHTSTIAIEYKSDNYDYRKTYHTLAKLEADQTLPDIIRVLNFVVETTSSAPEHFITSFRTDFPRNTIISVTGADSQLVSGKRADLDNYLRRHQKLGARLLGHERLFNVFAFIAGVIFSLGSLILLATWPHSKERALGLIIFGISLLIYSYMLESVTPFKLIIREKQSRRSRFLTVGNIGIVLSLVAIIVAVLAWLDPRLPH